MSQGGPLVLACTNLWEDGAGRRFLHLHLHHHPQNSVVRAPVPGIVSSSLIRFFPVCAATKSPLGTLSRTAPNHGTARQASLCLAPPHGEAKI